jgi:hypothetical protein
MSITYGEMLAVAARVMGDQFNDEHGRLTYPDPVNFPEQHDKAVRVVRRGLARAVSAKPDWNWLRQVVALDLEADEYEYDMPWFFLGHILGPVTFQTPGPMREALVVTPDVIERLRAGDGANQTGDPVYVTFYRDQKNDPSQPAMWKAAFYPTPSRDVTVLVAVRAEPEAMRDASDQFIAGSEFNRMIEAAVMLEAANEASPERRPVLMEEYERARADAIRNDDRSKARNGGKLSRTMGGWNGYPWDRVTDVSVNGVLVN